MVTEPKPHQVARRKLREHQALCQERFPSPFVHCIPGYTHPKCDDGFRLEREFIEALASNKGSL